MINIKYDDSKFLREMDNILKYTSGFLEGAQRGKRIMFQMVAEKSIEALKEYIDSSARVNPAALQHMYEWYQAGSPSARLFNLEYTTSANGLSINSTFTQSSSVKAGSTTPFYDKARIMESGTPVVIRPVRATKLSFDVDGNQVFTTGPVTVKEPGGELAAGSYEAAFNQFFSMYFSQAYLRSSGILGYLSKAEIYKRNLPAGKSLGKAKGIDIGYRWITNIDKVN